MGKAEIRPTEKAEEWWDYWKMKDGNSTAQTERTSIKTPT